MCVCVCAFKAHWLRASMRMCACKISVDMCVYVCLLRLTGCVGVCICVHVRYSQTSIYVYLCLCVCVCVVFL